mmetsp:Transcript_124282/g.264874  ORF Transcript_124282/g.264874 Transcript_124282/m.264874 type:complete len:245 (-) Transcript_124282:54-788(-)
MAMAMRRPMSPAQVEPRKLPAEVDQMVTLLDQRVTQVTQAEGARVRMLGDQTQRLLEGLQAMRVAREIHEERKLKELRMLESNVMLDLSKASQERRALGARIEEAGAMCLGEQCEALRDDLRQRDAACEACAREIGEETQRLATALEELRSARAEYGERIVQSLEAEFQRVHEAIVTEQKLRFEAEGTMLRMVEDVCSRMRGEVQRERQQREAVQGKLLGLLEETCNRIETSFSHIAQADQVMI